MVWGWIFKKLATGSQGMGLFGYLACKDQNKTRIKLEDARRQATRDIIDNLPSGAVYREGTPDGWREIMMPWEPRSSLFMLPIEQRDPTDSLAPTQLLPLPEALNQYDDANSLEGPQEPGQLS
jgi:hypothetical protein